MAAIATHHFDPVAAIRGTGGGIVGTGCLVLGRYVLTCAHVIDDALGRKNDTNTRPDAEIVVDLPFLDRKGLKTRVVDWYPMRPLDALASDPRADIAVLALVDSMKLPAGVRPEDVDRRSPMAETPFLTHGFPRGYDAGVLARGKVLDRIPGGWLQVSDTQALGYFIEPGFSGAPIFSATASGAIGDKPRLIGLAAQADRDKEKRLAFVVPAQNLCEALPLLARPYLGLFAFGEEEADLFFGRERFIDELRTKLESFPFTTVIGPSGAGKSSVVLAGLAPRLRAEGWLVAVCRPLRNPLRELVLGLMPLLDPRAMSVDAREKVAEDWSERLSKDPERVLDLARALEAGGKPGRVLVVIDQFEELFTADATAPDGALARKNDVTGEDGSPRQAAFLKVLEAIARQKPPHATVRAVATLRADFMAAALEIGRLARLFKDADVKLGPMTAADLGAAIRKPAARFGVGFEAGLVEEMVADMKGRPGGLPLLQFALERLWQRQEDRELGLLAYRGPDGRGGLETALEEHAEAVLAELLRERELGTAIEARVRRVMLRLVQLGAGDGSAPDARAVVRRSELRREDWPVVERLAVARLVMVGRDAASEETAEVAHEALIGAWSRLGGWLEADRAFGLWRQRLSVYLESWNGDSGATLLRDGLLAEARAWLASHHDQLNDKERSFIEASAQSATAETERKLREAEERRQLAEELAEQERKARENQTRLITLLRGALVLLFVAVLGVSYLWLDNRDQKNTALDAKAAETSARGEADKAASVARNAAASEKLAREQAESDKRQAQVNESRLLAALAQQEIRTADIGNAVGLARAALPASAADMRPVLLEPVQALYDAYPQLRELRVFRGHTGPVTGAIVLVDGRILTWSGDKTARIWNSDGTAGPTLDGHGDQVAGALELADGRILTWSQDWPAQFWNTDGTPGPELAGDEGVVDGALELADGSLLTWGTDGTVRLWDEEGLPGPVLGDHGGLTFPLRSGPLRAGILRT